MKKLTLVAVSWWKLIETSWADCPEQNGGLKFGLRRIYQISVVLLEVGAGYFWCWRSPDKPLSWADKSHRDVWWGGSCAPAASPLLHLALCELVQGAEPLENCSSSLTRSFSADGARYLGFWDSAEAAGTGEQAGSCVQCWTRSWVTLLLVAACDWIGLGISILWAPSLFIAMMWVSPNFQFWC